jgi:hypothetical protein
MVCIGVTETQGPVPDREETQIPATTKATTGQTIKFSNAVKKSKQSSTWQYQRALTTSSEGQQNLPELQTYQHHNISINRPTNAKKINKSEPEPPIIRAFTSIRGQQSATSKKNQSKQGLHRQPEHLTNN